MNKEAIYILGVAKGKNLSLTMKAVYYTVVAHEGQKRADNITDYSEHPIRVCRMLLNLKVYDDVTLAASLLHDTVEDKRVALRDVENEFGKEIAYLVDLVTKKEGMTPEEHYRNVSKDIRAILIKGVDRACNVDNMTDVFSVEKLKKYIAETETHILPMMKTARRNYLEHSDMLVVCRDYIKGVLRAAKKIVVFNEENEKLKKEVADLKCELKEYLGA